MYRIIYDFLQGISKGRRQGRSNASSVVILAISRPRQFDGYEIEYQIENRSPIGISEVSLFVSIGGEMELGGQASTSATVCIEQAIAAGSEYAGTLPHLVRFIEGSFDLDGEREGVTATLFWKDELGRRWCRTGGCAPERCSPTRFPAYPQLT